MRYYPLLALLAVTALAQDAAPPHPHLTEYWTPPLAHVETTGRTPSDAIVLFDGSSLDAWESLNKPGAPAPWDLTADGAMQIVPQSGGIRSKAAFGDVQLHLEFRTPAKIDGSGQGRGNSGVFFMERYELQILDGYNNPTYINGSVGSVYKQHVPLVNAARPPGTWQVYDIVFIAPRFASDGSLRSPARVTAFLNGVLVQHDVTLSGPTEYRGRPAYSPHAEALPIMLQDHNNTTAFRNIWARPLDLPAGPWENLFVGDLSRWDTWLDRPDAAGNHTETIGLNSDPLDVFSIVTVDNGPAIRISGQVPGALTTKADYRDYHLTLEYKWGTENPSPRHDAPPESGLRYHADGPTDGRNSASLLAQEIKIRAGEVGDYRSVGGAVADISAVRSAPDRPFVYTPGADLKQFGPAIPPQDQQTSDSRPTQCNRISNTAHDDREGWNRLDLYVLGGTSVHVVNGTVVMVLENSRRLLDDGTFVPLERGHIQLQSAGAEIYYRDIRLQPIARLPNGLLP